MQSSFSLMSSMHSLVSQLTSFSDNLSLVYTRKLLEIQTQWRQEMHCLVVASPLPLSPVSHDEDTLTRHKRRANLQQQLEYKNRENTKLIEKCKHSQLSCTPVIPLSQLPETFIYLQRHTHGTHGTILLYLPVTIDNTLLKLSLEILYFINIRHWNVNSYQINFKQSFFR